MKTIGITGTRTRDSESDFLLVEKAFLSVYSPGDRIVSGGCPHGGDRFAELLAIRIKEPMATTHWLLSLNAHERQEAIRRIEAPILIHWPDWKRDGRAAGFVRNTPIAEDSEILIACVAPSRHGGTEDTIKKFQAVHPGRRVIIV
jgi:hypothetical protein